MLTVWSLWEQYYLLSQMGAPEVPPEPIETETDGWRREMEPLKPEIQIIKNEVRWFDV